MKFMTVNEVAENLSVSRMTVNRLISSGKLKVLKINRAIRIPEQSFSDFVKKNMNSDTQKGTARSMLKHCRKWTGNDAEEIIKLIEETRAEAEF
jgi:excisionase family DNA binding protein